MHLIFLHGVPGVGKRTIAKALARELSFPFLDFNHLNQLLGPVFGYSGKTFGRLRNDAYHEILEAALKLPEDGLIASFIYDDFIDLEHYAGYIETAKSQGGIGLFVGLTCDEDELKGRVDDPNRHSSRVNDLEIMEDSYSKSSLDIELPGPSIIINTTGEEPEHTVQNILAMLPDDMMKGSLSF